MIRVSGPVGYIKQSNIHVTGVSGEDKKEKIIVENI